MQKNITNKQSDINLTTVNGSFKTIPKQLLLPTADQNISTIVDSKRFTSGVSTQNYPEDYPLLLREKNAYTNRILYLSQHSLYGLSIREIREIWDHTKRYCEKNDYYKHNRKVLGYSISTPVCYVYYKNVVFMVAKRGSIMSNRYTYYADGRTGILLYTDGRLFDRLLHTNSLQFKGSNHYPKPRFNCPFENGNGYAFLTFPKFVMFENGVQNEQKVVNHHVNDIRDNRRLYLEAVSSERHKEIHKEAAANNHTFHSENFIKYLNSELDIGGKERTFERNVCMIVSLLPFFKGIIIGDLDLTQDLRYVPISKIIGNINAI